MVLIGLDLSLTSSGVCCLPLDWDCTPSRCSVATVPYSRVPNDDTERAEQVAALGPRPMPRPGVWSPEAHDWHRRYLAIFNSCSAEFLAKSRRKAHP